MVTNDNSTFGGPLLKSVGIHKIKDVVRQGKLISFQEIAQCCAIQNINAGRIVRRLKQHIDYNLFEEKREGPANHICNWLVIKDNESTPIYKTNAKSNYVNLILNKFSVPRVQTIWQKIFLLSHNSERV